MVFDLLLYFIALDGSLLSTNTAQHHTKAKTLKCINGIFQLVTDVQEEEATEMKISKSYAKHYNSL